MIFPENQIVRAPLVLEPLPLVPIVDVIAPKLLQRGWPVVVLKKESPALPDELQPELGLLKRGVLVTPNASALNWKVNRSVSLKLRERLILKSKIPGPRNWLR